MASQLISSTRLVWITIVVLWVSAGCSTSSKVKTEAPEEFGRKERALGEVLVPDVTARIQSKQEIELDIYLRRVLSRVTSAIGGRFKDTPVGVHVYQDRKGQLTSYALPGLRVFVSVQALKALQYESELASLFAYEAAKVEAGLLLSRVAISIDAPTRVDELSIEVPPDEFKKRLPTNPDFFGPQGYFAFSEEEKTAALKRAVTILYDAGFDPRGILSLLEGWHKAGAKSPWPVETFDELREEVRTELNRYPPLRNPVVRSEEFIKMLKRIERL
jgi:hypothetical protein